MNHKSIKELANLLNEGVITSEELVQHCLSSIATIDSSNKRLNSIAEVDANALFIAKALDQERKEKGPRSILHGIPIAIKDNICTKDSMHTTAGSLALQDLITDFDAEVIKKLKEAGMIVMAKANLSEFAYFMSRENMPSGYSSRGGQVVHPYKEGFDPSGSSSGSAVAVAARIFPVTIGTETNGSLASPARSNAIATIKPTVGLVSRHGIIPISHRQDTAGPMGKTIEDCALLLEVMAGKDEKEYATYVCCDNTKYSEDLIEDIKGMRIGILSYEDYAYNERELNTIQSLKQMLTNLNAEGIEVSLPSAFVDSKQSLQHEFKYGINQFLSTVRGKTKMTSLKDIIEYNNEHKDKCLRYGQSLLLESEALSGLLKEEDYIVNRENVTRKCQKEIDTLLNENNLNCIITLINTGHAPVAGYPVAVIPAATLDEENPKPLSFVLWGTSFSEHTLIRVAYTLEKKLNLNCCPSWRKPVL